MRIFCFVILCALLGGNAFAQMPKNKSNLVVKEWKIPAGANARVLDQQTKYNAHGQKIEEIEYANYGQKSRTVYEYDAQGHCSRQVVYDSKDKPIRIRKFEYYDDGSKKKQYNYDPSGKLVSTREFEYIY